MPKIKNLEELMDKLTPKLEHYLRSFGIETERNFSCISPDHEDRNPSCSIQGNDKRTFFCHGCGIEGGIFAACHYLEGKPLHGQHFVQENVRYLADKFGIEYEMEEASEAELYRFDTLRAYQAAAEYIRRVPKSKKALKEIKRRGWTEELCFREGVGAVEDFKSFREYLKDKGFAAGFLDDIDLGRKDMFNEENLIFTIRDETGHPVGFACKILSDYNKGAKYVNQKTTGQKCNIYKKGERLYGFDYVMQVFRDDPPFIYVFEGYSDVLTARQNGIENCCAVGGVNFTYEHLRLLKTNNFYKICLCLDGDARGQGATSRLLDNIFSDHKDVDLYVIDIPEEEDPDGYIRKHGIEKFKRLQQKTAFEWRLNQFEDLGDDEAICAAMIPLVVNEPSYIKQEKMVSLLSNHTGISLQAIQSEVQRQQSDFENKKSLERRDIIKRMIKRLEFDPGQAEGVIAETESELHNLMRKYNEDSLSPDSFLSLLEAQKREQEEKGDEFSGFILGEDLEEFQNVLNGEWKEDVFCVLGGRSNAGKCLPESAMVLTGSGEYKSIKDMVEGKDDSVIAMDKFHKMVPAKVIGWQNVGEKQCANIKTIDGISIEAAYTHPFYTLNGWKKVSELQKGDRVAIASDLTCLNKGYERGISGDDTELLGHHIGDGAITEGDICFAEITEIENVGRKECYDLEVEKHHTFLANDFVVHNSSLCVKLGVAIASHLENDACVIYHSIDDSARQILPKFVCVSEGSRLLEINQVVNPGYHMAQGRKDIVQRRNAGYETLRQLGAEGRLILKDSGNGNSLAFSESLVKYYRSKYPSRRLVYILDNFHKLSDLASSDVDQGTYKAMSQRIKEMACKYRAAVIATVEYTKLVPGTRPTNYNISNSVQIDYDANLALHLYNELHEIRGRAENYHVVTVNSEVMKLPRIEMDFGKNKITDFKGSLCFNFYPYCSDIEGVRWDEVEREKEERKPEPSSSSSSGRYENIFK